MLFWEEDEKGGGDVAEKMIERGEMYLLVVGMRMRELGILSRRRDGGEVCCCFLF